MFDLQSEVKRLYQLRYDKIHGLQDKPKQYDKKIQHIDDIFFDIQAEREGIFIPKGFKNRSADFGRRLSKARGQYHRPGGGFAGYILKGV